MWCMLFTYRINEISQWLWLENNLPSWSFMNFSYTLNSQFPWHITHKAPLTCRKIYTIMRKYLFNFFQQWKYIPLKFLFWTILSQHYYTYRNCFLIFFLKQYYPHLQQEKCTSNICSWTKAFRTTFRDFLQFQRVNDVFTAVTEVHF